MDLTKLTESQRDHYYLNKAIRVLNDSAEYEATNIDNIIWKNGTTPILKADIEAKIEELKGA